MTSFYFNYIFSFEKVSPFKLKHAVTKQNEQKLHKLISKTQLILVWNCLRTQSVNKMHPETETSNSMMWKQKHVNFRHNVKGANTSDL